MVDLRAYRVHIIVGCQSSPPSVALPECTRLVHELSKETRIELLKGVLQRASGRPPEVPGDVEPLIVCNFVDGTEADGYPGISVTRELERRRLPFTGGDSRFCRVASSKTAQKAVFRKNGVATSEYQEIEPLQLSTDMDTAITSVGFPMIVKPIVSYGSLGISKASVVHDKQEACSQVRALFHSSHVNRVNQDGGVYVERFLNGPEYVAFLTGDATVGLKCYPVVQRLFHGAASREEQLLAFDAYWEDLRHGEDHRDDAGKEIFISYALVEDAALQGRLQELAKKAYAVLGGNGYAKIDIRADDDQNSNLYVLEVNVNAILSLESRMAVGQILEVAAIDPRVLVEDIISYAVQRQYNLDHPADEADDDPGSPGSPVTVQAGE
ncbi:D-alanine--D-alanine ligase-like [Paramacrobiotus metropolitanus]|uniref:D-alanine--D-alanine ligase-like n=1 Tax=Paramacrobiotus metropolitanus TaxID=2943436 RepID=UPI002445686C|nr:D-alanine--D-alanine ligase-like [Paramacrobiotus metropolitanus]